MVKGSWIKPGAVVIDVGVNFKDVPTSVRKSGKKVTSTPPESVAESAQRSLTDGARADVRRRRL
jgi:5,10-methylene-tetrahydrofolate dehydrogenase/methenyl tetrahydrofolate cyclohydrolase